MAAASTALDMGTPSPQLFDDCPKLNIIRGRLGERLPYSIWRVDHHNAWDETADPRAEESLGY